MPNPSDLLPPAPDPSPEAHGLLVGVVIVAPADRDDEVLVEVDNRAYEVRHWMPHGDVFPAPGDVALIGFVDREPWLVAFISGDSPFSHALLAGFRVEPGTPTGASNPGRMVARVGLEYDQTRTRVAMGSGREGREIGDPFDDRLGRAPGEGIAWPTGAVAAIASLNRKGPVGGSTIVVQDAAAAATSFYAMRLDQFPSEWAGDPDDRVALMVGDEEFTYTSWSAIKAKISGDHELGATSLIVSETNPDLPSVGRARGRGIEYAWTGRSLLYNGGADGDHLAGDTTFTLTGDVSALPDKGWFRVVTDGNGTLAHQYTAKVGNDFTIDAPGLRGNVGNGNSVQVVELTGITSCYEAPVATVSPDEDGVPAGATEIVLDTHFDSLALYNDIPESGTGRIEARDNDPEGPGAVDHPVLPFAFTARTIDAFNQTVTLTLDEPLPLGFDGRAHTQDDSGQIAAWVKVEGCPGINRAAAARNSTEIAFAKFNGVPGLTDPAPAGTVVQFSPRYRGPLPANNTIALLAADPWAVNGFVAQLASRTWKTLSNVVVTPDDLGGLVTETVVDEDTGFRRQIMHMLAQGIGVGLRDASLLDAIFHVGEPYTRTQEPDEFDFDSEDDIPPVIPAQLESGSLWVNTTSPFEVVGATSGRITLLVYNRDTEVKEERIFDFNGLEPNRFLNITYDGTDGYTLSDFFGDYGAIVTLVNPEDYAVARTDGGHHVGSLLTEENQLKDDVDGDLALNGDKVESQANKAQANGYAPLDINARVPVANLPSAAFNPNGFWDAATNTPAISDATSDAGDLYVISVSGTRDLGSGPVAWEAGRIMIHDGSAWQQGPGDLVVSINGQQGVVVLDAGDIANTPAGTIAATTVQAAIDELGSEKVDKATAAPRVRLKHSTDQSITNDTNTILTWDTEEYDTDSMHDPGSNPTRITINTSGHYLVGAGIEWGVSATGFRFANFVKNGSTNFGHQRVPTVTDASSRTFQQLSTPVELTAGDYIECQVRHTAGAALVVRASNGPVFHVTRLGA